MGLDEDHLRTLLSIHALFCMTPSIKREKKLLVLHSRAQLLHLSHFVSFFHSSSTMITEFLQPKRQFGFGEGKEEFAKVKSLRMMDQPELSLGPSLSTFVKSTNSSSSESDGNSRKKRKHTWDDQPISQTSVELQLNDPLPLDWEQCLDLQSGKMYYLNRKTLKKSWNRPKEQDLNLELNISTLPISEGSTSTIGLEDPRKHLSSSGSMVAVVCFNCHLLVMLCKSSPLCPNCKYVHSLLPSAPQAPIQRMDSVKSLETLSLLN